MGVTFMIHGIGKHFKGYSQSWVEALMSTGVDFGDEDFQEILWDPITQYMEKKYDVEKLLDEASKFFKRNEILNKINPDAIKAFMVDGGLDVYLYLTNRDARSYMFGSLEKPLIKEWNSENRDISILAHSLGSAISYELFHKLSRSDLYSDRRVVNFITFGSAIGIPYMRKDGASDNPFHDPDVYKPPIAQNWRNIYHELDPVACIYPLKGSYLTYGESMVISFQTKVHSAEGYLSRREVAEEIAKFIKPQRV